jgi:hypothetical protein
MNFLDGSILIILYFNVIFGIELFVRGKAEKVV